MEPETELLSTDDVANHLGLHVRTVRRYIREGRLAATKIGKQYRVAQADLEALVGHPASPARRPSAPARHVDVSSIVDIAPIDRDVASRVTRTILASAQGREPEQKSLRIDAMYDEARERLKLIATGSLTSTSVVLALVSDLLERAHD